MREKPAVYKREEQEFQRFTIQERVVHWVVGFSFVFLMLTGLAFFSPKLFWLTSLFGGGQLSRVLHPWVGLLFVAAFLVMFVSWLRDMMVRAEDREWLAHSREWLTLQAHEGLPEAGRFNAGQKMLFWTQAICGLLLLLSGIPLWTNFLWSTKSFPVAVRTLAILVHETAALVAIVAFIGHIYMGLFAVPGALYAMTRGLVTLTWARVHHPRWYREVVSKVAQKGS